MGDSQPPPLPHKSVEPWEVYNLPLYESFFVLDTRPATSFASETVATAYSFPPLNPGANLVNTLISALQHVIDEGQLPENISPIVIVGDSSVIEHTDAVINALVKLPLSDLSRVSESFHSFLKRLVSTGRGVWNVSGGYPAFKTAFPVLCGKLELNDLVPLPVYISEGIFHGARPIDFERRYGYRLGLKLETLRLLGITQVIVKKGTGMSKEDTEGLTIFEIDLPDKNEVDITPYLDSSVAFLENARSKSESTLVQFHGRSRSSSLLIAWAVKALRLSVNDALRFVRNRTSYRLDPSLMYLSQLHEWVNATPTINIALERAQPSYGGDAMQVGEDVEVERMQISM